MTLIRAILLFLVGTLPLASSKATGSKNCTKSEFWSSPNGCCLPIGGPPSPPPPPPKGTNCPPTSHYWGEKQGCCVPRHPPPVNGPPPQCPNKWQWNSTVRRCEPIPSQPSPPPSTPSHYYGEHNYGNNNNNNNGHTGGNGYGKDWQRRSSHLKSRSTRLCPVGLDACPISARTDDYECLDTATELESCGGCASVGNGQDCTAITGAWNVGCDQGRCIVYTCAGGFKRAEYGNTCIAL